MFNNSIFYRTPLVVASSNQIFLSLATSTIEFFEGISKLFMKLWLNEKFVEYQRCLKPKFHVPFLFA